MTSLNGVSCQPTNEFGEQLRWRRTEPLGVCIYNIKKKLTQTFKKKKYTYEEVSFVVGWISVAIWTVALLPQIISNCVHQSAESQSFLFWLLWLVGDICNLVGCILTRNLVTNIALAFVYLTVTVVAFVQYVYYEFFLPRMRSPPPTQQKVKQMIELETGTTEPSASAIQPLYRTPRERTAAFNLFTCIRLRKKKKGEGGGKGGGSCCTCKKNKKKKKGQLARVTPRMFNVDMHLVHPIQSELKGLLNDKRAKTAMDLMTMHIVPNNEEDDQGEHKAKKTKTYLSKTFPLLPTRTDAATRFDPKLRTENDADVDRDANRDADAADAKSRDIEALCLSQDSTSTIALQELQSLVPSADDKSNFI
ncbi:hypothetical protein RFI_17687 [Reticulomyxa filosa]|uniref:Uncharacterized protein n=1 Tax=Reticulomyxa filosa TaxID=46433 RepID=X6N0V6_RETFI|nr:hypothetical protein RFI_17687 [Reticulomyxa filosa]|eukprot:ETO19543.1 hypothetical protein RFI_17687 [Reticulomyxa filosa]